MYLVKTKKIARETKTDIGFEMVASDLLMLSFNNNKEDKASVLNYWRILGSGENPPLEVGINQKTGVVKNIIAFIDLNCFTDFQLSCRNILNGNIQIDLTIFDRVNRYIDVSEKYLVTLIDEIFVCIFGGPEFVIEETVCNGDIEFYIDENNQVRGFALKNLSYSEIEMLKNIQEI